MAKHQLGKKAKCYDAHTRTDGRPDVGWAHHVYNHRIIPNL